jgi:Tfp pilus assembly protein PilX
MAEREVYRVTARGVGGTIDAEALIQTTFIR